MIEIVAIELVDAHADRARSDERIEIVFVLVEEGDRGRHGLVREITPDLALAGPRIIRRANSGQQQQLDVKELERAQKHEIGGLLAFLARRIHIGHTGGPFAGAIQIDAHDFTLGTRLEIRIAKQHRQNRRLRRSLRIIGAAEPFAEAAKCALPERHAERIGVGLATDFPTVAGTACSQAAWRPQRIACGRSPASGLASGYGRERAPSNGLPPFWILPLKITGRARRAAEIFEVIVVRLKIIVGDAPILNRHVFRQKLFAVALRQMRTSHEVARQEAKRLRIPVQPTAADAVAEHEGAPVPHRQRRLVGVVAKRHRHLRRLQERVGAAAGTAARPGRRKWGSWKPCRARDRARSRPHRGRHHSSVVRENRARPSEPDDNGVFSGKPARHLSALTPKSRNLCGMTAVDWVTYCDQLG